MSISRIARRTALLATTLVVLATLAHGWSIAVDEPHRPPLVGMFAIERGEDYVAWTRVFASDDHVSVWYIANATPERVMLLIPAQLDRLLAGEEPAALMAFGAPEGAGRASFGRFDFRAPRPECPPPTGQCDEETIPLLVWAKGDAWSGAARTDGEHYSVLHDNWDGPIVEGEAREGPVRPDLTIAQTRIVRTAPFWLGLAAAGAGVGALAVLAHALLELRRRDEVALVPAAPSTESTETMLMLARLTALYVEAIQRSFAVSLAAILGVTAAVLLLGLPPMLDRASAQFRNMWELNDLHVALFVGAPVHVMLVALVLWWVGYARVQRELARWRDRAQRFEAEAGRILGA